MLDGILSLAEINWKKKERGCYKMGLEEVFKRREKYLVLNKPKNWKVRLDELKEIKRLVLRGD